MKATQKAVLEAKAKVDELNRAELAALTAVGDAPGQQITRDNLGKFVKGVSGNPKGKPKGAKSRTTLLRLAIEEMLLRETSGSMPEIVAKALEMAKDGDRAVIKLLLGDVLKAARVQDRPEDDEEKGKTTIKVTINNYAGPKPVKSPALDADFTPVEG